ncbi:MAG: 23S rRNA (pseudouridine(1915)-N(3))-methyltransferase RlmH [Bacilli bacterium]|nr:23S rRNA (pseudouridine(1915)-N(3))-methyltransferase RlmH [Bacilli bacterium]
MMINIICVGKLKDKYLVQMADDYLTRLTKYHKVVITELKDSNIKAEGDLILKLLNNKDYVVTMEIGGKNLSSVELSELIDKTFINYPSITFIIGGSDGIDKRVLEKSNFRLSFGRNTYPHGVFRCLLLEQIYRSFKILNNESYHK